MNSGIHCRNMESLRSTAGSSGNGDPLRINIQCEHEINRSNRIPDLEFHGLRMFVPPPELNQLSITDHVV